MLVPPEASGTSVLVVATGSDTWAGADDLKRDVTLCKVEVVLEGAAGGLEPGSGRLKMALTLYAFGVDNGRLLLVLGDVGLVTSLITIVSFALDEGTIVLVMVISVWG